MPNNLSYAQIRSLNEFVVPIKKPNHTEHSRGKFQNVVRRSLKTPPTSSFSFADNGGPDTLNTRVC